MADMQKLIETILSSGKLADSSNFSSKVYRDEPILITASQMTNFTPPKYREMRKIAKSYGLYYESDPKIFYTQGKFMEDFEDNFAYQGVFARYYPTYQSMNDQQLRGYFSWRTKVRRGTIEKTSLSFAYVYVYELLNQIGVRTAEDGFFALKRFWTEYRELDPQIDFHLAQWMNDYVVYYNLDKSLLEDVSSDTIDRAVLVLLNHKSNETCEVFWALNSLSPYNLGNSRFFKRYADDVQSVVCGVFSALSEYYEKNQKYNIYEKIFGNRYAAPYSMFKSAVFYHQRGQEDFVYEVNDIHHFKFQAGKWSCERFFCYKDKIQQIGALLKTIDFKMRQKYNFKSTLKADMPVEIWQEIVEQEIEKHLERKRKRALPKIEIDVTKLQGIRKSALETQHKLTIEESESTETPEAAMATVNGKEDMARQDDTALNDIEYALLRCLLYKKPYEDLIKSKGLLLSVIVDGINENLFERFGDTVIADRGDKPELIEDYIDELKGIIS